MSQMLEGLKVISMEHMEAMPAASVWLADWGAEVIKVEPLQGEKWRGGRKTSGNWAFHLLNRNKQSLALNLKTEQGRDILYKLVGQADVFLSNYQLGALNGLGCDYDSLKKINPGLVYAFLSGYGTRGPDKDRRGYDFTAAWARSGFQYMMGEPDGPPVRERGGMMDRTTAAHVVAGVCAALLHKTRTGEGQLLELSLYRSAVWTLALDIEHCLAGHEVVKTARSETFTPMINPYRTGDGRWFQLAMLNSDFTWPDFCRMISRPELEADTRFLTMEGMVDNGEELVAIMDEAFGEKTMNEWEAIFREYNVIYEVIQSPSEVINDPQAIANDFFAEIEHSEGNIKVINSPVRFVQNPAEVRTPAPETGQDNERILKSIDYNPEEIQGLREQGIVL